MTDAVLTLNAGSSSLKFTLFEAAGLDRLQLVWCGEVERIGSAPRFVARNPTGATLTEQTWSDAEQDFQSLLTTVIDWAEAHLGADTLVAVGHRVVHGGPDHNRPERVTPDLLTALDLLTPLAPLHEPHNVAPIRAIAAARADSWRSRPS